MRVLIANPPWPTEDGYGVRSGSRWPQRVKSKESWLSFPTFLAYATAVLKDHAIDVKLIDAVAMEMDENSFLKCVKKFDPNLVVLETSTPSIDLDLYFGKKIKKETNAIIALVGSHPTVFDIQILRENPFIDIICRGEYDYTVLDIVNNINNLEKVRGITYRKGKNIIRNLDRPLIENLDELPFPERDSIPWYKYYEPIYTKLPWITMITSRGCPYRCIFCNWPQTMFGHKFRARTVENVVDEIEYVVEKYRPGEIYFDDDTFTLNKKRVIAICNEIKRRKIDIIWSCMGRVDNVDLDMLKIMRSAGCVLIKYGVESADKNILKNCQKGITLEQVKNAVKWTKKAGIKEHLTFMFGLPGETKKTIQNTINFVKEIKPSSAQFSIAVPFPGTKFYELAREKGWIKAKLWAEFDGSLYSAIETEKIKREDIEMARRDAKIIFEFTNKSPFSIFKSIRSIRNIKDIYRKLQKLLIFIK